MDGGLNMKTWTREQMKRVWAAEADCPSMIYDFSSHSEGCVMSAFTFSLLENLQNEWCHQMSILTGITDDYL